MWSLGVVIYIMLCGYPPFYSEVPRKQLSQGMRRRIMAGEYDYPDKEWSKISSDAKDVIARYILGIPCFQIELFYLSYFEIQTKKYWARVHDVQAERSKDRAS